MTSLYDQFHSQKNINHMYNLINDLIQERIGKSIKDNMQYFTYYNNKLREIFIESEETDLIGLNKELLGHEDLSSTQIYTHVSIDKIKKVYKDAHPHAK